MYFSLARVLMCAQTVDKKYLGYQLRPEFLPGFFMKRPFLTIVNFNKRWRILATLLMAPIISFSQTENTQSQNTIQRLKSLGDQSSIDQIAPGSKVVGDTYLYNEWK